MVTSTAVYTCQILVNYSPQNLKQPYILQKKTKYGKIIVYLQNEIIVKPKTIKL